MSQDRSEKCLAVISQGVVDLQRGNLASADRYFGFAVKAARSLPKEHAQSLLPLTLCFLCLLRIKQGQIREAEQFRGLVTRLLDLDVPYMQTVVFHESIADVLVSLQEYRRAIPFYEQAAHLESSGNQPLEVARILSRAGDCYSRIGLRDHATVPLRAAIKIFRDHPGDPRLPGALLTLGNALRKTSPDEAERCYQEYAEFYSSKLQLESAATGWVNLGVLYSEQERNAESLAYYEKALRVREASPLTPPARIGLVLNNIANCHRRMGDFAEAHKLLDRALELLPSGAPALASAYGTRGLVFRDAGRDAEAVEWFRKAYAERMKMPSPNMESVASDLESEIEALKRLGRPEEAAVAEQQLASVHAEGKKMPDAKLDLNAMTSQSDGAVLVELDCGSRSGHRHGGRGEASQLGQKLAEAVESEAAGSYAGRVTIPESTTLMLYGADAEVLFRVIEPILLNQPICEGARVTIRQASQLREVLVPIRVM